MKPSDRYTVSLCSDCHALQHQFGELTFWSTIRIDPLNVAFRLWTVSGDIKAGERIVFRARQQIDLMKVNGLNDTHYLRIELQLRSSLIHAVIRQNRRGGILMPAALQALGFKAQWISRSPLFQCWWIGVDFSDEARGLKA